MLYKQEYLDATFFLRPVGESDLGTLMYHRNSPDVWENLTSPLPVWPHRQLEWLQTVGNQKDMYFIGGMQMKDKIATIGLLRATEIDWVNRTACVGVDVYEGYRGHGYGKALFNLLVSYCFSELNMHRLWLLVLEDNAPARHIYEREGFQVEGVMRKHIFRHNEYKDYILMGLLADEYNR